MDDFEAALEAASSEEGSSEVVEETAPVETESEPELTDFGKRYLQTIEDEAERQAVERHVRRWDAGYSKQEQKWNEFRTQYEQLGPVEELTYGKRLLNLFQTDPVKIAEYLHKQGIIYQPEEPEALAPETNDSAEAQRIAKLEQMTNVLLQQKAEEERERREQEQVALFKADLAAARKELGDFDEETVVSYIVAGSPSIEAAVKKYQSLTQNLINQNARKQAPTLLGSSGAAPTTKPAKSTGQMNSKEITDLLVSYLETE